MDKIFIYQFTDPTCVWSWGNEPELRAIEYLYGDKVEIRYVMGGLVEDITTLFNLELPKSQIIERANELIASDWLAASAIHGMPVVTKNMHLYSEQYSSSYPQNIAYHAARHIDPAAAKIFLRRMREATLTECKRTSQIDVLIELANEAGLDSAEFINHYTDSNSQTDFVSDRMMCRRNGITGFPSYLIKRADTYITLCGYQKLSSLQSAISRLSRDKIRPRRIGPSLANMMDFIKRYKRVYPKEIEVCFSLDENQTSLMLNTLSQSRRIHTTPVGNSSCISPMQSKQALSQSLDNIFSQPKDSKNTKNHKSPQKESNKIKEEA